MPYAPQAVADHYGKRDLAQTILAALRAAGKDVDRLTIDDLAPVDEFHTGGRNASARLAQLAEVKAGQRVLDVGCGIGGPSRYLASTFGCEVTGIDLTAEFVEVAIMLAERTGFSGKVTYRQGNALDLPFPDAAFDLVWSQNAAMNIEDRARLYGEMRRVLKTSGRLAIQDVAAGPGGKPYYPAPWARDESISFLMTPQRTRELIERAGFRVVSWIELDRGSPAAVSGARPSHRRRRAAAARYAYPDRRRFPGGGEQPPAQRRGAEDQSH